MGWFQKAMSCLELTTIKLELSSNLFISLPHTFAFWILVCLMQSVIAILESFTKSFARQR